MSSVTLHLLVTGSLYELVANFQKPGLFLPLCAHSLASETCYCTNIPLFIALALSHTCTQLSITQKLRERRHRSCSHTNVLTVLLAKKMLLPSCCPQPLVLTYKHLLCPMVTWIREVWKDRWAAEVKRKWLPAFFSISTHRSWHKLCGLAA